MLDASRLSLPLRRNMSGILVAALLASTILGCGQRGPKMGSIKGKVTLDGKPIAQAVVTFMPEEGGPASSGMTADDGTYRVACPLGEGAVVGKHRVSVRSQPPIPAMAGQVPDEDDPNYNPAWDASARAPAFVERIPARYNTKTELVRDVKPGENIIDLELTTAP